MKFLSCLNPKRSLLGVILILSSCLPLAAQDSAPPTDSIESEFISNARQLTFEGRRAGEGYFSPDGSLLVFQSERRADNPFFQIYLLDFETGDVDPISPGHGKTTCAWVHPNNNLVLYASTQNDPEAKAKQKQEIEFRESGESRRYSWDYDETYEIFAYDRTAKTYTQLTDARGYDAEGSYSPDGKLIAFASNRNGFSKPLDEKQQKMFETDPAYMMDIFIMNADGTNVRQLTDVPGYDGGPFFSPDGKRICWRRFSENGVTAEIMTMNIDGSDQKQLTQLGAMSWAPFYHPSGEYLIFTTNKHGFANFELYLVDAEGKSPPVRVTDTDGFDGLASFTPDGQKLTWTSNRNSKKESQIYLADWNHEAALEKFTRNVKIAQEEVEAFETGKNSAQQANTDFDQRDIMRHVDYLCRKELAGRMTGSSGERKATAYVAAYLDYLGLKPAGDDGTWFQKFDFPDGAEIGVKNKLALEIGEQSKSFEVNKDWRPLTFSGNVTVDPTEVVYAGYGIVAPERGEFGEYDSYVHLDVKDKWVMVFRFVPENVSPELRRHFKFYGELRKKIFYAREKGAKGLIVVSGPSSQVRNQLVPLQNDFSPSGSSIAAISVTDAVAQQMLTAAGKDLKALQDRLDDGSPGMGFNLEGFRVAAEIDIKKVIGKGRNVVGRLLAGDTPSADAVIVGAHIDHLGSGKIGSSLAKNDEKGSIHFGADDNASGVAAMLEIAEYIVAQQRAGKLKLKRDIIFAGWSGEELGLHGSQHFVESVKSSAPVEKKDTSHDFILGVSKTGEVLLNGKPADMDEVEQSLKFIAKSYPDFQIDVVAHPDAETDQVKSLMDKVTAQGVQKVVLTTKDPSATETVNSTGIIAALNMDMVGRLEDKLVLQGVSSSSYWPSVIESKNVVVGLPLTLSNETELPTDASSFYRAGIPILSAFTGSHTDYHTPRDTPEKLNYPDAARISRLMGLITRSLATVETAPDYIKQEAKAREVPRGGLRAYLGSVPSYGEDVVGVKLSDVTKGAPADKAGVRGGDIIVELAGKKIENIYDYTAIIDAIKIGEETNIAVMRDGQTLGVQDHAWLKAVTIANGDGVKRVRMNEENENGNSEPEKKTPTDETTGSQESSATAPQEPASRVGQSSASSKPGHTTTIAQYVSLGLLLGVIALFSFLFYEVMAKFLVPLFLAALLVVVFRPVHDWIDEKCGGREKLSALMTTAVVMLVVLVPIGLLLIMAAIEGKQLIRQFSPAQVVGELSQIRTNLGLDLPSPNELRVIDEQIFELQQNVETTAAVYDQHRTSLYLIQESAKSLAKQQGLQWPEIPANEEDRQPESEPAWESFVINLDRARRTHASLKSNDLDHATEGFEQEKQYQDQVKAMTASFTKFRTELLGGKARAAIVQMVNPSAEESDSYIKDGVRFLQEKVLSFGSAGVALVGNLCLGSAIMIIGLYFFLLDGPKMIETFKGLSPIDDAHEQELVTEFSKISRAVVLATLLSALAQGVLAGIGFYFAGLDSVFLLMVLSAVLAMVPFVGAAAVWVPCALYLYFVDHNLTAAIGLAVYGVAVISMADNIIKPYVLHGQSNIHPLFALLSVLGGVATLGPIGILVGPMVVAFLQTLLKILQREMTSMDAGADEDAVVNQST